MQKVRTPLQLTQQHMRRVMAPLQQIRLLTLKGILQRQMVPFHTQKVKVQLLLEMHSMYKENIISKIQKTNTLI
jgi:hypothetical protein